MTKPPDPMFLRRGILHSHSTYTVQSSNFSEFLQNKIKLEVKFVNVEAGKERRLRLQLKGYKTNIKE